MPQAPRTEALAASEPGRAASERQGAAFATEAEGLRLHLSSSSATGYLGVFQHSTNGRFYRHGADGKLVLATFDTAVEAAVAYARHVGEYQPPAPPAVTSSQEAPAVVTEAEILRLHLSSSNSTG